MKNKASGFSLLELIVTLLIIAILSSIAAPAFSNFMNRQSVEAQTYNVWRLLNTTRELAINSGKQISICGLNSNNQCDRSDIKKLVVYEDMNKNKTFDADEAVAHEININPKNKVLMRVSGRARTLTYNSTGYARQFGGIIVCSMSDEDVIEKITVNRAGRIYKSPDRDGDGRVEKATGEEIVCE